MPKRRFVSDAQAKIHWGMINAEAMTAIADYAVGRSAKDVEELLGIDSMTVTRHLRAYGVAYAVSGTEQCSGSLASQLSIRRVAELFKLYAPAIPKKKDVDEFVDEGFDQGEVAKTLAIAWAVAERAIKAGIVFEMSDDSIKIEIPRPWNIEIMSVAAKVRAASEFLNVANMRDLKKEVTRVEIFAADEEWKFQMERLQNLHGDKV